MYHFPNQQLYHHNPYQQCPLLIEETKLQNLNSISEGQYHHVLSENIGCNTQLLQVQTNIAQPTQVLPSQTDIESTLRDIPSVKDNNTKKTTKTIVSKRLKIDTTVIKRNESKKPAKKPSVDTSTFSIEERLVAAVWVHERKHTSSTISEIKHNFRRRFGREPPSKTTLFAWECKLFSTGNVCDAPRTGRPVNRKSHISEVAASVRSAPTLSLRARALALRLPRSTLHNILRNDLPSLHTTPNHKPENKADEQPPKRRIKQPPRKPPPPPPRPGSPPHPHMHYVMHATHTQGHGYT